MRQSGFQCKRMLDLMVAVPALVLLAPLLLLLALVIRWKLGAPIFFGQLRPGKEGIPFKLIKFRTMAETLDQNGNPLPDALRLTALGRFLRSTSLDELPELWNVVRGEMSLVGPRPLLLEYLPLYAPWQHRRHEVLPGITGWAQINGRNDLAWDDKFKLDVWYVENQSLWLDLMILWRTLGVTLHRKGISQTGHCTAEPFKGNASLL